jgi:hypothetical protein
MHVKIKLVALLFLLNGFANAADKNYAFKNAVNYCNCRIAYEYCNQYSGMIPESDEKKSFDKLQDIFKCNFSHTLSYDSINNILNRNNFSSFSKKSSTVMSRILKTEVEALSTEEAVSRIISGIYESKEFKNILIQYSEVGSLKETLTRKVSEYLNQSFGEIESPVVDNSQNKVPLTETELQKEIKRLENLITEYKTGPFSINWLSIILVAILSSAIYFILKLKLTAFEERLDRHRKEIDLIDTKKNDGFNKQSNQNLNINEFKRSVERNISDLNLAINSLQSDVGRLSFKEQSQTDFQEPYSNPTPQVEKQQRLEILFAPIPNRDGSFNASKVTSTEDQSASFYKFTITDNLSQKATFEFFNVERAIKDATSSPELILNPVCRIKNALNQNAKRIKTVKPGSVEKQNDKWIVYQLAEIEYE